MFRQTQGDNPARPARKGWMQCLLPLLLSQFAAPTLAFDEAPSQLPVTHPLHDRGWLVDPGFHGDLGKGLYHEAWASDPYGARNDADRYTGIRHRFGGGLGLDTGIAQYGFGPPATHYQEYYLGLSYDAWQGRVWYTDDYQGSGTARSYYELGVTGQLGTDLSLSARFAYGDNGLGFSREPHPAYVFSAQKRDLYGFGLNLQLMGSSDTGRAETEDLRFMGILSRPLP